MYNKKLNYSTGLPRNRTVKGAARKKMKSCNKQILPSQSPPNPRTDEDSGLGGDSTFDGDSSADSASPLARAGSLSAINTPQASSSNTPRLGKSVSGVVFPTTFGMQEKIFVNTGIVSAKRPRLDMTEEANELPEEELNKSHCSSEANPKIVSFKNVPELILPANAVQIQPTILSLPRQARQQCLEHVITSNHVTTSMRSSTAREKTTKRRAKSHLLEGNLSAVSSDGAYELELLTQPEGQHRARYQTEGSRGAVKDRAGTGHPCVKLKGYEQSAVLQVFVASDGGSVSPHLFYQACKVSGKNSTPCKEERVHGTTVLEIMMLPARDMTVSCDCVGILKERNVDVEQRLKSFVSRSKKKSTKCRLVFRTTVTLQNGTQELLQVVSQPISCTQPPGVPEICRKSLSQCSVEGKEELFIIGKNFYKDTEVLFREVEGPQQDERVLWSHSVTPEKDFLQSNHLICQVPPYRDTSVKVEVEVQVIVVSCGKMSDPHSLTYQPLALKKGRTSVTEETYAAEGQPESDPPYTLPKGVSPSAVKLNRLYEKSGGGLPLDSKECYLLSRSPSQPFIKSSEPSLRDRAGVQAMHGNKVLATVTPQIQATSFITKSVRKSSDSTTFTTATVLTPKATPNAVPLVTSNPNPVEGSSVEEKLQVKDKSVLENLGQMLKLLTSLPGSLQTPIVDLVADEILKQLKKESCPTRQENTESQKAISSTLSSLGTLACLRSNSTTTQQVPKANPQKETLNYETQECYPQPNDQVDQATCAQQPNTPVKLYPLIKPSSDHFTLHTSSQGTFVETRVTDSRPANSQTMSAAPFHRSQDPTLCTNTKVVYPVSPLMTKEQNFMNANSKVQYTECGQGNQPARLSVVHTLCRPNTTVALNVAGTTLQLPKQPSGRESFPPSYAEYFTMKEEKACSNVDEKINNKIDFFVSQSPATTLVSMATPVMSGDSLVQSSPINQTLFNEGFKLPVAPVGKVGTSHTLRSQHLNKEETTSQIKSDNFLHRPLKTQLLSQVPLKEEGPLTPTTTSTFELDEIPSHVTIDNAALALQMENCDPLLSQANAVPAPAPLTLAQTTDESPMNDHASMIQCPSSSIGVSVPPEVSIAQLSENDLLNYINPTCFDNV